MPDTTEQVKPEAPLTAHGRYEQLKVHRSPYEQRAEDAAEYTLPTLFPHEGANGATLFTTPYQSVGARGVNNLAAKLLLALFPPGSSFFKLAVDEFVLDAMSEGQAEDTKGEVEEALSKVERAITGKLESKNTRATLFEAFKHLLVTGNGLLAIMPDGTLKFFTLRQYVVKRDLEGNPVEILVKESLDRRTLPKAAQEIIQRAASTGGYDEKKPLELFTWVRLKDNGSWRVHQEICGEKIPGTEGFYPKDNSAWLPLRWAAVSGEDYGRGFVEEYLGDVRSLESLSMSLVDFAAAASKILFLVDEGGVTDKEKIAKAPNLKVMDGNAKDVSVLQVEKMADFQVAKAQADEIKQRLEQAFLLTSSIQRQAERVTAEEIRTMAAELEQSLGGIYSVLAGELQRPLVVRLMFIMQRAKELPFLPKSVQPRIVTGLEGLGRTSDLLRLDAWLAGMQQSFGPEAVSEYVNVGAYGVRRAAALSIDIKGLVRSEEEVQAARAQRAEQAMAEKLGPQAIKSTTDQNIAAQEAQAAQPQQ